MNKQIYLFAEKWHEKFNNINTDYIELVEHYMADDCIALGFEMDCGNSFSEKYGDAICNSRELEKVIMDVTDVQLLGSAIFSRWRYFNHWAYDGREILERKNIEWFLIALNRLAELTKS